MSIVFRALYLVADCHKISEQLVCDFVTSLDWSICSCHCDRRNFTRYGPHWWPQLGLWARGMHHIIFLAKRVEEWILFFVREWSCIVASVVERPGCLGHCFIVPP